MAFRNTIKGSICNKCLFSDFELQDSAKVFIFNYKKSRVIGAFTSKNNSNSKILSTIPVRQIKLLLSIMNQREIQ